MGKPWENHGKMVIYIVIDGLVGGLEPWNFMTFHILGRIISTDELHHFFRGVGIPPTRYHRWKIQDSFFQPVIQNCIRKKHVEKHVRCFVDSG